MFKWLARRILSKEVISDLFLEVLSDEDVQKQIIAMSDQLFERYKKKTLGAIGGLQKGLNYAQEDGLSSLAGIVDSRGSIRLNRLIPVLVQALSTKKLNNQQNKDDSGNSFEGALKIG